MEDANTVEQETATSPPGSVPAATQEKGSTTLLAKSPEEIIYREKEAAWKTASDAVKKTKYELWGLKAGLDPRLRGGHCTLANLMGQCLTKKVKEFEYEICFFRHAQQRSTS